MPAPIWQNLISHRADVDPLELLPQEHNFRIHALNQRQVTTASLDELGHVGDIIVNVRTGKIVNGHLRVELAIAEDQATVPVTYIDCDVATEQIVLAFFDEVGSKAITDADRLRATIAKIDIGSSTLQASLEEWALTLKPRKGKKGKKGEREELDDDELGEELDDDDLGFLDDEPPAPAQVAPPVVAVAPAPAIEPEAVEPVVPAVVPAEIAPPALVVADDAGEDLPATLPLELSSEPLGGDDGDGAGEGVAPALTEPIAPPAPAQPVLAVVQDDALAAAIVEDVRAAQAEESPPAPVAPSAVDAPAEYVVKVGEYDQLVPASVFAPWFAAICAQVGNGHSQLSAEVRRRLGFE